VAQWESKRHQVEVAARRQQVAREELQERLLADDLRSQAISRTKQHLEKERKEELAREKILKDKTAKELYNLQVCNFQPPVHAQEHQRRRRSRPRDKGNTFPDLTRRDPQQNEMKIQRSRVKGIAARLGNVALEEHNVYSIQQVKSETDEQQERVQHYGGEVLQLPRIQ